MRFSISVFAILSFLALAGCDQKEPVEPAPQDLAAPILQGTHALRKMFPQTTQNSSFGGSYLFMYGSSTTDINVKFAWLMNDGKTWAISSIPIEKVRVQFDEKATLPKIEFSWMSLTYQPDEQALETQRLMGDQVSYVVITVRSEDWPTQIQLPLNGPPKQEE